MVRQAAVNRALGLGRVPLMNARIIRALDKSGLLGAGIRVVGTNAIYAYEAIAGGTSIPVWRQPKTSISCWILGRGFLL
jgi:hypothetical protein